MPEITLKGSSQGIRVVVPSSLAPDDALELLDAKLAEAEGFLGTAGLIVEYDIESLPLAFLERLQEVINRFPSLWLAGIRAGVPSESSSSGGHVVSMNPDEPGWTVLTAGDDQRLRTYHIEAQHLWHTVRSGQEVNVRGNLFIHGNVNPGAKVSASGDVYVLGTLRGLAHSGCEGDQATIVYADDFNPTQVRIAALTAMPGPVNQQDRPQAAYIHAGSIRVSSWSELLQIDEAVDELSASESTTQVSQRLAEMGRTLARTPASRAVGRP